jgi:hypothetical protein
MAASLSSCTVGIENYNGTDGLQIVNNSAYIENQLAVLIASDPEWLSLNHYAGRLYNGNTAAIVLNILTEDLAMGDYSMDMEITTNDPSNSFTVIPITMTVTNEIPVELASFTAENLEDMVVLSWQTSTETNNSGFAIERMYFPNAKSEIQNLHWTQVGFVPGYGTTTEPRSYSFSDENISSGTYKYRLKQIDFDGTVSFSSEIEVEVSGPNEYALYQNYPNPFNPSTTIKFALPEKTSLELSVYNSLGEKVAEVFKGELDGGYHEIVFKAAVGHSGRQGLSSGIYFYRIESENFVSVKKMILMK